MSVEIQAEVHFDQPNLKPIQRKLQNVMPLRVKQKQIRTSRLQTQNNMHVSQVSALLFPRATYYCLPCD